MTDGVSQAQGEVTNRGPAAGARAPCLNDQSSDSGQVPPLLCTPTSLLVRSGNETPSPLRVLWGLNEPTACGVWRVACGRPVRSHGGLGVSSSSPHKVGLTRCLRVASPFSPDTNSHPPTVTGWSQPQKSSWKGAGRVCLAGRFWNSPQVICLSLTHPGGRSGAAVLMSASELP